MLTNCGLRFFLNFGLLKLKKKNEFKKKIVDFEEEKKNNVDFDNLKTL